MKTAIYILLCTIIISGCRQHPESKLIAFESLIESKPDSALTLLENYSIPSDASLYEKAKYELLLNYALFKCFKDPDNIATLQNCKNFFLKNGYNKEASQALFLIGMIEKDNNRLGDAAVCFLKGIDIADEAKEFKWKGQCARGMCELYGDLMDASAQLRYAEVEYESFSKCNLDDWKAYAKLDILRALNNMGKNDDVISMGDELLAIAINEKDSLLFGETQALIGTSLCINGEYAKSLEAYATAIHYNSDAMTPNRIAIASIASSQIEEGLSSAAQSFVDSLKSEISYMDEYSVLAEQGNFKEAYRMLEAYRIRQDSIISKILKSNVSQTIGQYEDAKKQIKIYEHKIDKISNYLAFIMIVIAIIVTYYEVIEKRRYENRILQKRIYDLQIAINELSNPKNDRAENCGNTIREEMPMTINELRKQYSKYGNVFDSCYQLSLSKRNKMTQEIINMVSEFTEHKNLETIGHKADEATNGLFSDFKNDFYDLSDENINLFLFLMLDISSRGISFLINQSVNAVYNKKSRLKARISKSEASRKDEYLSVF